MGVFKEIERADGTGTTTFYRISEEHSTVETDGDEITREMFDYNDALNKPSINDVPLVGNKTLEDLGIQPAGDYLTEIPEEYVTEEELEAKDYADKLYVDTAIANVEHFHREVVNALPHTGKDNVLYLVPKSGTSGDVYNEYIWTGSTFELIGTTAPDLTIFYKKEETDALLNNKVDKIAGKGLSTNDFTNEDKNKLDSLENYDDDELRSMVDALHNYDDTAIRADVDALVTLTNAHTTDIDTLKEDIKEKLEAIFLIKSGDQWLWQNRKGDNISFQTAQEKLGLENYILVIEYLETDGKITPRAYISLNDRINVYYTDENNREHILTIGESILEDNILGYEASFKSSVADKTRLPANVIAGTICVTEDDENIYIYTGSKWIAANPNALIDLTQFLSKTNTVAYAPTADYHPATKLYVDQQIAKLDEKTVIPTKLSQLYNDVGFVPKTTTELVNYYTKGNLYTKSEIDYMLSLLKTEGRIHSYSWDSNTYEGNANDVIAAQVLFDEYLNGEVYTLSLKLKDIKDDFNGLYTIWEFRFDGHNGHLYMCAGGKTYSYGYTDPTQSAIVNSNAILDIEFSDISGPYVVTSATLRRKEDVLGDFLSTSTGVDVDYVPTLGGHPVTKRYADEIDTRLDTRITNEVATLNNTIDPLIKTVNYDSSTGILTFTQDNGGTQTVDLPLEYLIQSGTYNTTTRQLELTLANGDIIYIDAKDLVDEYYADEISLHMDTTNNTFEIKDGYLADVATSGDYSDLTNRNALYQLSGASANQVNNITISTEDPTGGNSGDIWIKYQ